MPDFDDGAMRWDDACTAAALMATDPALGGVCLRALPGPVREEWLSQLREWLPADTPWRRIPLHVSDDRLLGGLDLAATLRAGRPVAEQGILAAAHGGVVLLAMAERIEAGPAARLGMALDTGELQVQRDGFALRLPARFSVVALDEGISDDEHPPPALLDRLAFHVELSDIGLQSLALVQPPLLADVEAARRQLAGVQTDHDTREALCATAMAFGVKSLRASLQALRAARAMAALRGAGTVNADDVGVAARLVLGPRATQLPMPPEATDRESTPPPAEDRSDYAATEKPDSASDLKELTVAAVAASLPDALLQRLEAAGERARAQRASGPAGRKKLSHQRGRPAGTLAGPPQNGARLSVVETLRAAAPWQPLRAREVRGRGRHQRVRVRTEDFRVTRYVDKTGTTTIFAVDASGSTALHRLAETKGAVELLLADCYVRRARVALVAFRGQSADLLLPPTGSLLRAKRALAGLPGGGATPLAAGIDLARLQAEAVQRRGELPIMVLLTDGRANVGRDGRTGRAEAVDDALSAASEVQAAGIPAMLVDTSPRPQARAEALAERMSAHYLPLPYVDASRLSAAVRNFSPGPGVSRRANG